MVDRSLEAELNGLDNPLWRLLVPSPGSGAPPATSEERRIVFLSPGGGDPTWRGSLTARIDRAPVGATVLVAAERKWASALLTRVARRRWRRKSTPSLAQVERALRDAGVEVRQRYRLWPSVKSPRLAVQGDDARAMRWIQRSGVLGGGGRRLSTRALARSRLFTPFARFLSPGMALVGTKEKDGRRS